MPYLFKWGTSFTKVEHFFSAWQNNRFWLRTLLQRVSPNGTFQDIQHSFLMGNAYSCVYEIIWNLCHSNKEHRSPARRVKWKAVTQRKKVKLRGTLRHVVEYRNSSIYLTSVLGAGRFTPTGSKLHTLWKRRRPLGHACVTVNLFPRI
jgi:hypothetical protein